MSLNVGVSGSSRRRRAHRSPLGLGHALTIAQENAAVERVLVSGFWTKRVSEGGRVLSLQAGAHRTARLP